MTLYYERMGWGAYTTDYPEHDMQPADGASVALCDVPVRVRLPGRLGRGATPQNRY